MEHRPRLPREGINVSREHPLKEALLLVLGVGVVVLILVGVGLVAVDLLIPRIPASWEIRVFGPLARSASEQMESSEGERHRQLQQLLERLAAHWPDTPYTFQASILEKPTPNALAFPGRVIAVTSGLLENLDSENELAFILGHELGHFRHRDHLRSLGRGAVLQLVLSLASSVGGGSPGVLIQLGPLLAERSYAREQERAADRFGLELVQREYGHVAAATDFFARAPDGKQSQPGSLAAYFLTHPLSPDRVDALVALAGERGWSREGSLRSWPPAGSR